MDFEGLKTILQNWLSPETEDEEIEEEEEVIIEKTPVKNYTLKAPLTKTSKSDQFDNLFGDDEDESTEDDGDSPF
jgi:hypothetical protein